MARAIISSCQDIYALTALDIADAVGAGRLSAVTVVKAFLERIALWRPLNACVLIDRDDALARAYDLDAALAAGRHVGRLAGVPFLVKDNIEIAGQPCAAGTPGLRDNVAVQTAPVVSALLAEGAILLGRSNMHELALGITTGNPMCGIARNPYDLDHIPGGSSGGAGAALAARLAPLALGTDTGASVRAPAAFCGVSALRPSVGNGGGDRRYPLTGVVPLSPTRDTVGPMARTLKDVAAVDAIICSDHAFPQIDLSRIRLGLPRRVLWNNLDHDVARICEDAIDRMEKAGVTLVEAEIDGLSAVDDRTSLIVTLFELRPSLQTYLAERGDRFTYEQLANAIASDDVAALEALARTVTAADYSRAIEITLPALRRAYEEYFMQNRLDGYIFPTVPIPAPPIDPSGSGHVEINGVEQPGGPAALFSTVIRNLDLNSLAGIPSVAFPAGLTRAGLPVGLEIDGPLGSDRRLLAIGAAVEALLEGVPPPREPFLVPKV